MEKWAIVENGLVANICLWDGIEPWNMPESCTVVMLASDEPVDIGMEYVLP